ncbi:zinc transporter ZIP3-like [Brevipalpus obovatus]|uniref:zinc transporter ZIP3-like n=1 Tax=Brevipalpus obovatus TaxID=246614 RepID=UPI003D9E7043
METYVVYQMFFAITMFIGTFLSYYLPIKLIGRLSENSHQQATLLSYCNLLSAGIFIAICFLGLFPVVRKEFDEFFKEAAIHSVTYPVAELTILLGFFLVITLEQIMINCRSKKPPVLYLDDIQEQSHHLLDDNHHHNSSSIREAESSRIVDKPGAQLPLNIGVNDGDSQNHHMHQSLNPNSHHSSHHSHHHHHSGHHHDHLADMNPRDISFFMLFFATGVHSIFEGMALGLMKIPSQALHLYIGIILHECLVAIALAINSTQVSGNIRFGVLFSSTVPVGIVLGVLVGYTRGSIGRLISSIFQGLAAGTFIHVAFYELIPHELSGSNASGSVKLFKIFVLFLGFLIMAFIGFITSDGH